MSRSASYGLEQARIQLPAIVAQAGAGVASVITRHGKPCAAVVPMKDLRDSLRVSGILALRGSGRGLWGRSAGAAVAELRDEWGDA